MKKTVCALLCAAIVCGLCGGIAFQAKAAGEVYVTHNFPSSIKLGDNLADLPDTKLYYHNVPYDIIAPFEDIQGPPDISPGGAGGPMEYDVDSQGNVSYDVFRYDDWTPAYPGEWVITPEILGLREPYPGEAEGGFDGYYKEVGKETLENSKIKVVIEKPVITTNAPSSVKIGSTIRLTTALTNHHIKNKKVADYAEALAHDQDPNFHISNDDWANTDKYFAYQPSVTVIEGKELVRQSDQDYSNTLSTSETLTFTGAGTVQLKIVYHQINTSGSRLVLGGDGFWGGQPEKNVYEDHRYHPEKIITINVTDPNAKPSSPSGGGTTAPGKDSASPSGGSTQPGAAEGTTQVPDIPKVDDQPVIVVSEETGIRVGAQQGVLPDGTELSASPVTQGETFDRVESLMTEIADRFSVFDLALESGGVRVQPNGKVTVSIPIPEGYDRSRLAIYYMDENGVKTELPCAVDGDSVTFETDHFSTYVVAEKTAAAIASERDSSEAAAAEDQPAEGSAPSALWITLGILGAVLVAGAVIAAVLIRRRRVQK